jgi:DNA-binding transcriptional MerR regulator
MTMMTTARDSLNKSPTAFRTISEVSTDLDVPQHVLRFWESKFSQIRPLKRGGGRRYYRPDDVDLLRGIRDLLYESGYTIKGVQKLIRENGVRYVVGLGRDGNGHAAPAPNGVNGHDETELETVIEVIAKEESGLNKSLGIDKAPPEQTRITALPEDDPIVYPLEVGLSAEHRETLETVLVELEELRELLTTRRV